LNRRKLIGVVALGLLLALAWAAPYVPGLSQDHWGTWWKLAYAIAVGAALFAAFYDRRNFPEKALDFNPQRGLMYFFLGWIIFPVMLGLEAISGTDFALSRMVLGTLALSTLAGIAGTFTENIGL
jgi:cytochrome bd-type quinol oxidase subunit 2